MEQENSSTVIDASIHPNNASQRITPGHLTRAAEAMRRLIANQIEEERPSANERKGQKNGSNASRAA
ncbi:unnamed protein product [Onchocerca ochengi]|uniref:Transcriptional regulator n=1 Tax=Onchocerca ochengi TaxID=42157 RepID=A0A182EJ50_ONCOC|nr:unnamed protein product [Onchocerca ochengi]